MVPPGFLELPARSAKPRSRGLTHALDKGFPLAALGGYLESSGPFVDVWKLGWGTAYVDERAPSKVALLAAAGVRACVGGTLLEVAWVQGKADACLDWAADSGFDCIEVSNGTVGMPAPEKRALISRAESRFTVVSEVGSKDPAAPMSGASWALEMRADLDAGATWVLAEGRESGTVGLYESDGSVRAPVVDAVVDAVGLGSVVFEAPRKDQQAWFIRTFGTDVNLGNVAPDEAAGLEALRLGLRADTAAAPSLSARPGPVV
jgi:phosphosulfolactate synthase